MQTILVLLFAAGAQGSFDPMACQHLIQEMKTDCMNDDCIGLISTGVGGKRPNMDPQDCERECLMMAKWSAERDQICLQPARQGSPEKKSNSQVDSQNNAKSNAKEGETALKAKEVKAKEAAQVSREFQQTRIDSSKDLIQRWERELASSKSQDFPADRTQWANDRKLVKEAERAKEKKEIFPEKKADQASLPAIRGNLNHFSRAQKLESEAAKDLSLLAIAIAQLAQMKSSGEANAKTLGPGAESPISAFTLPSSGAKDWANSPLKVSSIKGNTSEKSGIETETETKDGEAFPEAATYAATRPKDDSTPSALRAQLRELIRKKMAVTGLDEIPEQFLGELSSAPGNLAGDLSSEEANFSKIEEEIFRLAGAETDAEVSRLRSELEEELARTEGVLPSESLSLFERVKAAYDACAAKQCVAPAVPLVASREP